MDIFKQRIAVPALLVLVVVALLAWTMPAEATHPHPTPSPTSSSSCRSGSNAALQCKYDSGGALTEVKSRSYRESSNDHPDAVFVNPFTADALSASNVEGDDGDTPPQIPVVENSRGRLDTRSQSAALLVLPKLGVALGGQKAISNDSLIKLAGAIASQSSTGVKIVRLHGPDRVDTMIGTLKEYHGR